ncbi:unnamed protein product [Ectocarpus sp. CCAP 1310/34]|nr:unnamed protein product [Ectocarpus sp. CCAP 1310/34]
MTMPSPLTAASTVLRLRMRLALAGLMVAVLRTGCAFCLYTGHLSCNSGGRGSVTHCGGLTRRGVFGRAKALSRSKTRRHILRASWAGERLSGHARRLDNALEHEPEHEHEHRDATVVARLLVRRHGRRVFEPGNMGMATVVEGDRPPVMPFVGISIEGALTYPSSAAVPSMSVHMAQECTHLLGPEAVRPRTDTKMGKNRGGAKASNGGSGGQGGGEKGANKGGGGGDGGGEGQRGNNGPEGDSVVVVAGNSTESLRLEDGVEVDKELVSRSPLLRTIAPVFRFFRSRAGLYGMMLGYVVFTVSQHISPVFVGMSLLTAIGPRPARKVLVLATQCLSVLTVASYLQDQFRHQVYPLPTVASGPSAPYAIVTGGSSGIGREIANELAGRGYNILLVARGKEGLKRAAKDLTEASREAAEVARREREEGEDDGRQASASRRDSESRRDRKRRRRQERKESMCRSATSSASSATQSPSSSAQTSKRNGSGAAVGLSSNSSSFIGPHSDRELEQERGKGQEREDAAAATAVAPHLAEAVTARWFAADLGNATSAQAVYAEVQRLNLTVDILVNAAGLCRVGRVNNCAEEDLTSQLMLNVVGTSQLTRLFAKDFVRRRKGRIMVVSSVVSAAPNPTVAAYAASKSYLTSFAEALHSELEVSGVGVTCVMPGATRTSFQDNSGSTAALVWQLPLFSMEADEVAARAVEALMRGDRTVVPGWQNKLYVHVLAPLLPRKIVMSFAEAMWR